MPKKSQNLDNLNELRTNSQLKTDLTKLQRENSAAYKTIDKLIADNKKKEEEIAHLKTLLEQSVPVLIEDKTPQKVLNFEVEPEEEIAEVQLHKLKEISRTRALTLEETRQYDLLVKNKRLAKEQSTINLESKDFNNVKEADLIAIAGKSDGSGKSS